MIETSKIKSLAEFYVNSANEIDSIKQRQRIEFRKLIQIQFAHISQIIHFDFTEDDPYSYTSIAEVLKDYNKGFIRVNTSGNNSVIWGPVYNLMFRAVHDWIHCRYKLEFTFEDEVKAYNYQIMHSQRMYDLSDKNLEVFQKLLRSEIVYQAAYKEAFKEFHLPEQKIVLKIPNSFP